MTPAVARVLRATTAAQGVPERLDDPVVAARISVLLDVPTTTKGRSIEVTSNAERPGAESPIAERVPGTGPRSGG